MTNKLFPELIKRRTSYATVKVYGKTAKTTSYGQHYWHTRKDGVRQRYVHKVTKTFKRYREKVFSGAKEDLKKEIVDWVEEQQEDDWDWIEKEDESL